MDKKMKDKEKQFKERIDCGIAYCEDTPNRQIEEMKDIVHNLWDKLNQDAITTDDIIDALYNANCRIVKKDSVMLTREEYNDLILAKKTFASDGEEVSSDTLLSTFKGIKEQARKETAEKCRDFVKQWVGNSEEGLGFLFDFEDFIKKQFGAEIRE